MPPMADSPSSVSTVSDDTDSILPTPELYSGEMAPPDQDNARETRGMEKIDIFSPVIATDSPSFSSPTHSIPIPAPTLHRTFSTSKSSARAPAPPPILLRRPTDQPGQSSAKGLNINLNSPAHEKEEEEETDGVPDLIPSPRRQAFTSQLRNNEGAPISPAWMSMEGSPGSSSGFRMPLGSAPRRGSTGLFPPPSPLVGHTTAGYDGSMASSSTSAGLLSPMLGGSPQPPRSNRKFDPTPIHGIHARNMSLFFPQPGSTANTNGLGIPMSPEPVSREQVIPPHVQSGRKPFGGQGEWSFGGNTGGGRGVGSPESVKSKRRGHHHKHSLSHNFFSFLDPTLTNPSLSTSTSAPLLPPSTPKPADTPQPVPMPLHSSSLTPHSPTLSPLPRASDPMSQLLASFSVLEFLIGAALWVEGQMGGWRCLAGVGYLVVFDAIGVGVGVVARGGEGWRSVRRPYGTTRFLSLLYFSQSLFLVFASVYIAKESIEQVVLGASGNEHGGHGHGHGHGHGGGDLLDGEERPFPAFLLLCATLASAVGGGIMHTHAKLVDAVGSLFLSPRYLTSPLVRRFPHLLANPFSVTVMGSSAVVLIGTIIVPLSSLHTFDALAALILTVLTAALSLPPSKAFGQVLLQTAPSASTSQMKTLQRAIKDIKADHRVRSITQTRCWAITAGSAPPPVPTPDIDNSPTISPAVSRRPSYSPGIGNQATAWHSPSTSPTVGEFGGIHPSQYPSLLKSGQDAPLVLTMEVEVDSDMADKEVMELTKVVWGKLGRVCKGSRGVGEVTVGIKRVKVG